MKREEALRRLVLIKSALEQLDFDRIHKVMTALDWKWLRDGYTSVPSRKSIKDGANLLAKQLMMADEYTHTATGGFEVDTDKERSFVRISFVLTDCSADSEDIDDEMDFKS